MVGYSVIATPISPGVCLIVPGEVVVSAATVPVMKIRRIRNPAINRLYSI
jgi:hypothetical protein